MSARLLGRPALALTLFKADPRGSPDFLAESPIVDETEQIRLVIEKLNDLIERVRVFEGRVEKGFAEIDERIKRLERQVVERVSAK